MTNRVLAALGCRYPILQSPMGWIARSRLASAVSAAGGFGMIETSSGEIEACLSEIAAMRRLTDRPFGVNLPLMLLGDNSSIIAQLRTAGVRFVTTSAGDPSSWLPMLKDAGITVYHAVASRRMAERAIRAGVDGLLVDGHEGAGFRNPAGVSTLVLLRSVRQLTELPLIATGGIADGYGMAAAFCAGAEAVQLGTRFLASVESPVHDHYKQAILATADSGTMLVNSDSRPLMRVLATDKARQIGAGPMPEDTFTAIRRLYFDGRMNDSIALAGQSAGLIDDIPPVNQIIERIVEEFFAAQASAARRCDRRIF